MKVPKTRGAAAVIWQGTHHEWEYNHRVNRLGSYVTQRVDGAGALRARVIHTAASGTGNDTAHFKDFVTELRDVEGVGFLAGCAEITVECQRGDLTPFVIRVEDVDLPPALQGRDAITAILNGFDLYAEQHSEKIITFDIDVTQVTTYAGGTKARFYIVGHLRFDCRSPECQLLPIRLESEPVEPPGGAEEVAEDESVCALPPERPKRGLDRRKYDKAVLWLKHRLATLMGVDEVKRSLVGTDEDSARRRLFRILRRRIYLRFLKWELSAPYVLRVHYLLIAGDGDAFAVRETETFEHAYRWDLEHEIRRETDGVLPVAVPAGDLADYAANLLAFRRISMDIAIDEKLGTEDPVQWGKGMHLLEWSVAIRNVVPDAQGLRAELDLFYRCWSEAMNQVITLTTWGAVRGAGRARFGARLALLQFKRARPGPQLAMPGRIYWPGGGRRACEDQRARFERPPGALVQEEA